MQTIKRGAIGQAVALWQREIGISPDGVFGPITEKATKEWQAKHGLVADGIVGPKTWLKALEISDPLPPLVRGCDVSAIQGDLDDKCWAAMAAQDIKFAYMRLVVGNETWVDGKAKINAQRARAHGIVPGYYVFPYPLPHLNPKSQVERFVKLLEGLGTNLGELPPMWDLEWPPPEDWKKWKCSPDQLHDWNLTALDYADELTGVTWACYSYRWWIKMAELARAGDFGKRPLVLADYTLKGKWPTPHEVAALTTPKPWSSLVMVQHDGDGGLRLPNGRDADFDVMPGGQEALDAFAKGAFFPAASTFATEKHVILPHPDPDLVAAKESATRIMLDEQISAYRRSRFDIVA